jgi:AraC-like DNA-binding protein
MKGVVQEIAFQYSGKDPQLYAMHTHGGFEILQIIEGSGSVIVNDKIYDLTPGAIFVINGESFHCTYPNEITHYVRNTIQFSPQLIIQMLGMADIEELSPFLPNPKDNINFILNEENRRQIDTLFRYMKQAEDKKYKDFDLAVSALIIRIFAILSDLTPLHSHEIHLSQSQMIARNIMQYVTGHIDDFSLESLAEHLHMSKYYLCHTFRDATGMTIHSYLNERRIVQANKLLKTGKPISEIAMELGFSSFSLFCRTYKNLSGLSPSDYRKEYRGK